MAVITVGRYPVRENCDLHLLREHPSLRFRIIHTLSPPYINLCRIYTTCAQTFKSASKQRNNSVEYVTITIDRRTYTIYVEPASGGRAQQNMNISPGAQQCAGIMRNYGVVVGSRAQSMKCGTLSLGTSGD